MRRKAYVRWRIKINDVVDPRLIGGNLYLGFGPKDTGRTMRIRSECGVCAKG